jgi:hypothetical protein
MQKNVLILSATKAEQNLLSQQIQKSISNKIAIEFKVLGIGKRFRKSIGSLKLTKYDYVLLIGLAGAIKETFQTGDIVCPEYIFLSGQESPIKNYSFSGEIKAQGKLFCATKVIKDQEKVKLSETYDYVDMESYYFAEHCQKQKVNFSVIKSVLDSSSTKIPNKKYIKSSLSKIKIVDLIMLVSKPRDLINVIVYYKNLQKAIKANVRTIAKTLRFMIL